MKTLFQKMTAGYALGLCLLAAVLTPKVAAQAIITTDGVTGLPNNRLMNFTNSTAGVGGFHTTNTIHQITNGSTTIASSWIPLRGRGATLWSFFNPTNALLTNAVAEFRFSPDGTNAATEPVFLWRTATAAHAVGEYGAMTNLAQAFTGEAKFIQLWKLHFTNGVNNVGSVFFTNNQSTVSLQFF